ncbi:MAG: squalene synthase HpnC [Candidatus Binatia bacterium]
MSELAVAYATCERLARAHYENFPLGSWLLPRRLRRDLAAVYAFARMGDDVADEGAASVAERLAALDALEEKLVACATDPAAVADPVFVALGNTLRAHALPVQPFRDLLGAFRRDAAGDTRAFATFADLLAYCRCSANPVGRIVLGLFGHRDAERQARSDDICTALQLTNFCQDVRDDLDARGRVYIPGEDLDRFAGSHQALAARTTTDALRACLAFQVVRTRELFARGGVLADMVDGRLRREVRLFAAGGIAILDRIEAANYDVLARRPRLGRGDIARLVWKELWR